jgi:hypothetical protein
MPYTYYIKSPHLDDKGLLARGNWKLWNGEDKIDLLIIERSEFPFGIKDFYDIKVGVENFMNIEGFDKYNLINSFLKNEKEKHFVQNQIALKP